MQQQGRGPEADPRERRRKWIAVLLRSLGIVTVLLVAYFVLPMDRLSDTAAALLCAGGLVFVSALCGWQTWRIMHSPTPLLRAVEALALTLPTYLFGSATTAFLLSQWDPASFSEPLTRIDALYFTMTVFATVGFGDIVAVEQTARVVVTVMMTGNLVMLAVGVKLLTAAVKWGQAHRDASGGDRSS